MKDTPLGTIRTMRDDLNSATGPTIATLPKKEEQSGAQKVSKIEATSQNASQKLTADTKAPVPPPKITTKPPLTPTPPPLEQDKKPSPKSDETSFYSTPSPTPSKPRTSRDILDELLPIEDKNVKTQPSPIISQKKSMPIPKFAPVSVPPQRVTLPGQTSKSNDVLEEEIFPSPQMEEVRQETPEELLGLTQKSQPSKPTPTLPTTKGEEQNRESLTSRWPRKNEDGSERPNQRTNLEEIGITPKQAEFVPAPEKLEPPLPVSKTIDLQKPPMEKTSETPVPPPPPPVAQPLSTRGELPKKRKLFLSKSLILMGLSVLIGASLFGTILYLIFSDNEPDITEIDTTEKIEEEETEEKVEVDTTPPPSLVTPDFIIDNVTIENTLEDTLKGLLKDLKEAAASPNTISYIPIKLEGVVINQKTQYLGTMSFLNSLEIITPLDLSDVVQPNFMLYLYTPGEEERIACQNNLVTEKECWGPRLGLVLKIQPETEIKLQDILSQWLTIVGSANLGTLILNDLAQIPVDAVSQSGVYQSQEVLSAPEIVVYYVNAPMAKYDNLELSGTALDFAIVNDMLILATSKNSMRTMIDYILQQQ